MSNPSDNPLVPHTFGRDMAQVDSLTTPLPPSQLQAQMSASTQPQHGSALPDDFDQIVRNIGEW